MIPTHQEPGKTVTGERDGWAIEPKTEIRAKVAPRPRRFLADRALVGAFALLPAASAAIAYASSKRSRSARSLAVAAGVVAGLAAFRWQLARAFTRQPEYEVERKMRGLEIRRYPAMVIAETTLSRRNWDRALDEGFRRLARYIFGTNTPRREADAGARAWPRAPGPHEKLPMAAPVTTLFQPAEEYTVAFIMPADRDVASLPVPRDDRIRLREVGPRSVAVLRFRGSYRHAPVRAKIGQLMGRLERAALRPHGEPSFAGYDPPTTLPFLRRNEVWMEIEPTETLSAWLSSSLVKG